MADVDFDVIPSKVDDYDISGDILDPIKDTQNEPEDEDIPQLEKMWVLEVNSPEILQYEEDLVASVRDQVKNQQDRLDEIMAEEDPNTLYVNLHQMELDRINHIVRAYLRARLMKIEKYGFYITKHAEQMEKLSEQEQEHVESYVDCLEEHFYESFLKHLPTENARQLEAEDEKMIPEPNLNIHVIFRALSNLGEIAVDDVSANFDSSECAIIPYRAVRNIIHDGMAELV